MALPPNTYRDMFYEPLLTPGLFDAILTGGGPAYVDIAPGAMPEPVEFTTPAPPPVDEFQQRIARAEEMARGMSSPNAGLLPPAAPAPSIQPSAPLIMSAPSVQPSAPPIMAAPAPEEEYLNPFDAEAYEYNAPSLSQSGRVQQYTPPVAGATPQYTQGGMLVFNTHQGGMGGFAAPIAGATYALIDNKTGKVITSGTGQAGLEQVWRASQDRSADMGKKANWTAVGVDPTTGRQFNVAQDRPPASALGVAADFVLPAIGGAIGGPLGAAAGSAASSVAQGRDITNTLLRAGITAGTAAAIGAAPGMGAATGSKVGSAAGSAAASKISPLLGEIIVQGTTAAVPAFVGSAAGGALSNLANMAPGRGADFADRVFEQPTSPAVQVDPSGNPIVVTGAVDAALPASVVIGAGANAAVPPIINPDNSMILTGQTPPPAPEVPPLVPPIPTPAPAPVVTPEGEMILTGNRPPVESPARPALPPLPVGFNPGPLGSTLPDMTKTPVDVPNPAEKNSLLDEIIKYYRLASTGLDLLGSAFGGGGAGRMTPYASQLGLMPTFTRGPFTPFGGDYETYGFGPEFNFFGGAPAPTPTAPGMGILPPRANPGFGIV